MCPDRVANNTIITVGFGVDLLFGIFIRCGATNYSSNYLKLTSGNPLVLYLQHWAMGKKGYRAKKAAETENCELLLGFYGRPVLQVVGGGNLVL
jgi:hypothetical protein